MPHFNDQKCHQEKTKSAEKTSHGAFQGVKTSHGAECKACKKSLKTKDGNTSGLHRHLEKKYSQDYVEYSEKTDDSLHPPPKKKQRTMVEMLETKSKYDKDNSIQKQFDFAMLDYFCTDLASFSAVEGRGFKKLFDIANPKLSLHVAQNNIFKKAFNSVKRSSSWNEEHNNGDYAKSKKCCIYF